MRGIKYRHDQEKSLKDESKKTNYEPTARESAAWEAFRAHQAANPAPCWKISNTEDRTTIEPDHPEDAIAYLLLMEAIGTMDMDFAQGLVNQLVNAGSQDQKANANGLNFMLSIVKGVKPKDEVEAMLAAQMAAVHMATMTFARRLTANGAQSWCFRFRDPRSAKPTRATIGKYPVLSLQQARERAGTLQRQVASDENPVERKRRERDTASRKHSRLLPNGISTSMPGGTSDQRTQTTEIFACMSCRNGGTAVMTKCAR